MRYTEAALSGLVYAHLSGILGGGKRIWPSDACPGCGASDAETTHSMLGGREASLVRSKGLCWMPGVGIFASLAVAKALYPDGGHRGLRIARRAGGAVVNVTPWLRLPPLPAQASCIERRACDRCDRGGVEGRLHTRQQYDVALPRTGSFVTHEWWGDPWACAPAAVFGPREREVILSLGLRGVSLVPVLERSPGRMSRAEVGGRRGSRTGTP